MEDANDEDGFVQIVNEVLAHRNKKITTVAAHGGDMIRMIGDFVDGRGRMSNQTRWSNFVWQCLDPYINTWANKLM